MSIMLFEICNNFASTLEIESTILTKWTKIAPSKYKAIRYKVFLNIKFSKFFSHNSIDLMIYSFLIYNFILCEYYLGGSPS